MDFTKTVLVHVDIDRLANYIYSTGISDLLIDFQGFKEDDFKAIDYKKVVEAVAFKLLFLVDNKEVK